jgi:hypothetical protein
LTAALATDIINAASGGVTSRYLVLNASAGVPNLSIQEGAAPRLLGCWTGRFHDVLRLRRERF